MRPAPNVLIIGAQRSGTTSLHEYLCQHPSIRGPVTFKETHYFDRFHRSGMRFYRSNFGIQPPLGRPRIVLDATPIYMWDPRCLPRIREELGAVRLIAILRNPVLRAFSHFQHSRGLGKESCESFERAIELETERLDGEREKMLANPDYLSDSYVNHSYVSRGMYAGQIDRAFQQFGRERVLVLQAEAMFRDPASELSRVVAFLGLPEFEFDTSQRFNSTVARQAGMQPDTSERLHAVFRRPNEELFERIGSRFDW